MVRGLAMKIVIAMLILFFSLFLVSFAFVLSATEFEKEVFEEIKPQKDEEIMKLLKGIDSSKSTVIINAKKTLMQMDRERLINALAYALGQKDYCNSALHFIRYKVPDKRLSPFVAKCIEEYSKDATRGYSILLAVEAAKELNDKILLASLLDKAIESEYVHQRIYSGAPPISHYYSVFGAAAEALFVITEGEIGIEKVTNTKPFPEKKKELIAEWKAWWEENKPKENIKD
jgi:hypothetical protein